jgi:hypothetical protein
MNDSAVVFSSAPSSNSPPREQLAEAVTGERDASREHEEAALRLQLGEVSAKCAVLVEQKLDMEQLVAALQRERDALVSYKAELECDRDSLVQCREDAEYWRERCNLLGNNLCRMQASLAANNDVIESLESQVVAEGRNCLAVQNSLATMRTELTVTNEIVAAQQRNISYWQVSGEMATLYELANCGVTCGRSIETSIPRLRLLTFVPISFRAELRFRIQECCPFAPQHISPLRKALWYPQVRRHVELQSGWRARGRHTTGIRGGGRIRSNRRRSSAGLAEKERHTGGLQK